MVNKKSKEVKVTSINDELIEKTYQLLEDIKELDLQKLSSSEKRELINLVDMRIEKAAKHDFWLFCLYWDYQFFNNRSEALIEMAKIYQMLYEDELDEAYISIAPSSGKTYVIELFQAWVLGKDHLDSIMYNSYNDDKAQDVSKAVKEMLTDDRYIKVFGNKIPKRGFSQSRVWKLQGANKESFFVGSAKGQGTGYHARWILGDDLVKNIYDGLNEDLLSKIYMWWLAVPETRKEKVNGKKAKVVILGTRWNDNDPIGKKRQFYEEMRKRKQVISEDLEIWTLSDGRKVAILSIRAIKKNGKSYCEEIYTTDQLKSIQRESGELLFSAVFQQEPVNAKGRLFAPKDINRYNPKDFMKDKDGYLMRDFIIGRVDLADKGKDKTCSIIGYVVGEDIFVPEVILTDDDLETAKPRIAGQIEQQPKIDQYIVESNFEGRSTAVYLRQNTSYKSKRVIYDEVTTKNKEAKILLKSGYIKSHFYFLEPHLYDPGSDYDNMMKQLFKYLKMKPKQADDVPDVLASMCNDIDKYNKKSKKITSIFTG